MARAGRRPDRFVTPPSHERSEPPVDPFVDRCFESTPDQPPDQPLDPRGSLTFGGPLERVRAVDELASARPRAADVPHRTDVRSIAHRLRELEGRAPDGPGEDEAVVVDPTDVITRSARGRSGREQRVFRATPASTRGIRGFVRDALQAACARDEVIADFQLVVSELAANAIEHGTGDDVVVEVDATRPAWWEVTVSSTSAGTRLGPARDWTIAGADAGSGRGLGIVRRLMDDVRVERRGDRLSVRCRVRR